VAKYSLQPSEKRLVKTSSRFLSIIELDGQMQIESPAYNLKPVRVKPGWQLDLDGIQEVYIENIDSVAISAELQDAGIRISSGGGGAVSVTNKPVIQRIEEPMPFNANVTFTEGSVTLVSPNTLDTLPDKVCGISTSTMLANVSADRTTLIIQNLSDTYALRVGGNQVTGNQGFMLEAGGTMSLSTKAAIFAYNANPETVSVSLTEL
jgi:hypothetical protein